MSASFHQRVGVFIDVQNMFYATKNLYGSKLNYSKLLDYIARGRDLVRSIAYVVQTPEIDQSNFLTMLRSNGYEVRSKELKQRPDGSCKGDWDMGLALDALSMSDRLDVVAIVSGDGDFVDLVNFLKARGVRVEIYSFPYSTAEELRYVATEYFRMGTEIVMNPQPGRHAAGHNGNGNGPRNTFVEERSFSRETARETARESDHDYDLQLHEESSSDRDEYEVEESHN